MAVRPLSSYITSEATAADGGFLLVRRSMGEAENGVGGEAENDVGDEAQSSPGEREEG